MGVGERSVSFDNDQLQAALVYKLLRGGLEVSLGSVDRGGSCWW